MAGGFWTLARPGVGGRKFDGFGAMARIRLPDTGTDVVVVEWTAVVRVTGLLLRLVEADRGRREEAVVEIVDFGSCTKPAVALEGVELVATSADALVSVVNPTLLSGWPIAMGMDKPVATFGIIPDGATDNIIGPPVNGPQLASALKMSCVGILMVNCSSTRAPASGVTWSSMGGSPGKSIDTGANSPDAFNTLIVRGIKGGSEELFDKV